MPIVEYFHTEPDGSIDLVARAEGGGAVGDMRSTIRKGDVLTWPKGLTYEALAKAGSGTLEIADDESFEIKTR